MHLAILLALVSGCSLNHLRPYGYDAADYTLADYAVVAANIGCVVLENVATENAIRHGGREGNPLLRERGVRIPVTIATSALAWWAGERTGWRKTWNGAKAVFSCSAGTWGVAGQ